jgi:hypothetical protein
MSQNGTPTAQQSQHYATQMLGLPNTPFVQSGMAKLTSAFAGINGRPLMSRTEWNMMLRAMDHNQDGQITPREIHRAVRKANQSTDSVDLLNRMGAPTGSHRMAQQPALSEKAQGLNNLQPLQSMLVDQRFSGGGRETTTALTKLPNGHFGVQEITSQTGMLGEKTVLNTRMGTLSAADAIREANKDPRTEPVTWGLQQWG